MAMARSENLNEQELRTLRQKATLNANPHLSKAMLKRTGFEHNFVEPELSIEERQIESEHYSNEHSICERIETATLRYKMNRKFHQETMKVFHAFLNFAGFDERPSGFTGGSNKAEAEDLSKEEKARRKQVNYVSKGVIESVESADGKWIVDFEGVTKGFFSTSFSDQFLFHDDVEHDKKVTNAACNVLRNYFNYLLYHNVCTEYTDQIRAALAALEVIESEYVRLAEVQSSFPGSFSKACSILCGGYYAKVQYQGDWMAGDVETDPDTGLTAQEAEWVACAGVAAFATRSLSGDLDISAELKSVKMEEEVGFEISAIILPTETSEETQKFFSKLKGTIVSPMGKLICKRYQFQHTAPLDLPSIDVPGNDSFQLVLDEETLQKCYPGLKFIATVKETNAGLHFIDYWSECYGTFYTWCWNDKSKDRKEGSDPYQPAKPKNRANYSDFVPLGEDKMLENRDLAAEQDPSLEVLSSTDAHVPQVNGHDSVNAKPTSSEMDTGVGHEGVETSADVSEHFNKDNSVASEGDNMEAEFEGEIGSSEELGGDEGLFSDEEGSEDNDD